MNPPRPGSPPSRNATAFRRGLRAPATRNRLAFHRPPAPITPPRPAASGQIAPNQGKSRQIRPNPTRSSHPQITRPASDWAGWSCRRSAPTPHSLPACAPDRFGFQNPGPRISPAGSFPPLSAPIRALRGNPTASHQIRVNPTRSRWIKADQGPADRATARGWQKASPRRKGTAFRSVSIAPNPSPPPPHPAQSDQIQVNPSESK